MTPAANVGLAVFVVMVVLDAGGLLLDLGLWLLGLPTITSKVMATPGLCVPILALQLAGTAGLALHFLARAK
jgi:hypothetical protein